MNLPVSLMLRLSAAGAAATLLAACSMGGLFGGGNAELAEALGLAKDFSGSGMGKRFARSAMLIRDGIVDAVFVEDAPGVSASGAPAILMALEAARS